MKKEVSFLTSILHPTLSKMNYHRVRRLKFLNPKSKKLNPKSNVTTIKTSAVTSPKKLSDSISAPITKP